MLLQTQATARCTACDGITPVNAAALQIACGVCGASLQLDAGLWCSALEQVVQRAETLDKSAQTTMDFAQGDCELQLQISRTPAACPHCDEPWTDDVAGPFHCPGCDLQISVRAAPVEVEGLHYLVAEDRGLLQGKRGSTKTETLRCTGCGAPLSADGTSRSLVCHSCGCSSVLSDELWRRLHADDIVSTWFIQVTGPGSAALLGEHLHTFSLSTDAQGRVIISAYYGDDQPSVLCFDRDDGIVWMRDMSGYGDDWRATALPSGHVVAHSRMGPTAHVLMGPEGEVRTQLRYAREPMWVAADIDDTVLAMVQPDMQLVRLRLDGTPCALWPASGFMGAVTAFFGGGPPTRGDVHSIWGLGHDGHLRIVTFGGVQCIDRQGKQLWRFDAPEGTNLSTDRPPCAAADGTTYAHYMQIEGQDARWGLLRIEAGGSGCDRLLERPVGLEAPEHFAVTPDGLLWLSTAAGTLQLLSPDGQILWQKRS